MKEDIYKFHTKGIHCKSCALLTEKELISFPYIREVKTSLKFNLVEIRGVFDDKNPEDVANELNKVLATHGFTISVEKIQKKVNWKEFLVALPIATIFIVLFIFLQKIGIVNFVNISEISYSSAFVIGIIASLSSCMAVVGGLVLSMSASYAKGGNKIKPQAMFHIARIISFFFLGGLIGLIGKAFELTISSILILDFIIALIMLILGFDLLGIFSWTKIFQPTMPKFIAKHAIRISEIEHILMPIFLGIATFFFPCGFTQTMQLYALKTSSFLSGGLIMLFFSLGTLPVLALLSFSSVAISKSSKSGIFYKSIGLIVILFAIFNILNALVLVGILRPIFYF